MSIYICVGRRRLGKSTLARYMAHNKSPRLFIDPRAQWKGARIYRREDAESMLEDFEAGRDVIVQPAEKQATIDALASVAALWFSEEPLAEGQEVGTRELSIVLDEAGTYDLKAWDWFMRTCDVQRTSIILTAHRPKDLDTTVRAIADTWCIFRTTQRHDLDAIEDRTSELVIKNVQTLEPFEFVEWDDAQARMTVHKNPGAWKDPKPIRLEGKLIEERREPKLWD